MSCAVSPTFSGDDTHDRDLLDVKLTSDPPDWYRVWVVQEIAASRQILIFCGMQTLSWESILFAAYILNYRVDTRVLVHEYHKCNATKRDNPGTTQGLQSGIQRIMSIESSRDDIQQGKTGQRDSLLLVLSNHRFTEASDRRDKFIALVGLVKNKEGDSLAILPNIYHKERTVSDVYRSAVQTLVLQLKETEQHIKPLDFLDWAGQSSIKDLPSWVPDWSCTKRRAVPLLYWQIGSQRHPDLVQIDASSHYQSPRFEIQDRRGALVAKGFVLDCIGEPTSTQRLLVEDSTILDTPEEKCRYPTGDDISNVIWRTLVLDRCHTDGLKAPSEWGDIFYRHIARIPESSGPETLTRNIYEQWYEQNKYFKVCGVTVEHIALLRQRGSPGPKDDTRALAHFKSAFVTAVGHRKLASTERGYVCLVPQNALPGDLVVVLADCSAPIILRKWPWSQCFEFLGTAYVHGIMYGEAVRNPENLFTRDFEIR